MDNNDMMPWEDPNSPWKNKSQFMTYLRGCLRKAWQNHPLKHNLIKAKRIQVPNPNPKGRKSTVWGFQCELCGTQDVIKNCQVDHKVPAGSLREIEDIQGFAERLLVVNSDSLRVICKDCNSSLAYADKHGMSFEEAKIIKQAIATQKDGQDKSFIAENGREPQSNAKKRREQIVDILREAQN